MEWIKFIVCLFFGCFGVHKFMEKKKKLGFLFLFTIGLFGFGWLFDCCKYLILALKATTTKISGNKKSYSTISTYSSENHPVELPAVDVKMHIKNILLWIATIFFALIGFFFLIGGGTFAGIVAIAFVALVIPIDKWQAKIKKVINRKFKPLLACILAVLCFATIPNTEPADLDEENTPSIATTSANTIADETIESTTATTTVSITEVTSEPVVEETTVPTTKPPVETPTAPAAESIPTTTKATESERSTEPAVTPATEKVTEPPTEPVDNTPTGITFISYPQTVSRNETGTVTIQGIPNTVYSITVYYKSGPSEAEGLEPKTSDSNGYVSWSWKVGGRTSAGTFKIVVSGGGDSQTVNFTVAE